MRLGQPITAPTRWPPASIDGSSRATISPRRRWRSRAVRERGRRTRRRASAAIASARPRERAAVRRRARAGGKTRRHQIAPLKAVDAIEAATRCRSRPGAGASASCSSSACAAEQAKALIHVFFAERAASKLPGTSPKIDAAPVARSRSSARARWAADRDGLRERGPQVPARLDCRDARRGRRPRSGGTTRRRSRAAVSRRTVVAERLARIRAAARRSPASTRPTW